MFYVLQYCLYLVPSLRLRGASNLSGHARPVPLVCDHCPIRWRYHVLKGLGHPQALPSMSMNDITLRSLDTSNMSDDGSDGELDENESGVSCDRIGKGL